VGSGVGDATAATGSTAAGGAALTGAVGVGATAAAGAGVAAGSAGAASGRRSPRRVAVPAGALRPPRLSAEAGPLAPLRRESLPDREDPGMPFDMDGGPPDDFERRRITRRPTRVSSPLLSADVPGVVGTFDTVRAGRRRVPAPRMTRSKRSFFDIKTSSARRLNRRRGGGCEAAGGQSSELDRLSGVRGHSDKRRSACRACVATTDWPVATAGNPGSANGATDTAVAVSVDSEVPQACAILFGGVGRPLERPSTEA
jgi:hypothetical protein